MIEMDSFDIMMTALKFNEKINKQDLEGLAELMTDDHTFIDSSGDITKGKDAMKEGWRKFFEQFPDYRNVFKSVTVENNTVIVVGYSACSYKQLEGRNIWTAKVHSGRVSEWRVYWLDQR
jgi:uncharacterized protein (TIGR02246 family)